MKAKYLRKINSNNGETTTHFSQEPQNHTTRWGGTSVNMDLVTFTPEAALHNPGNLEGHALIEGEYMCQKDLARFQVFSLTKFCST